MTVNCFQVTDGPKLIPCEYSFAIDAIKQQTAKIWIDLQDVETSELEEKLDDLKVEGMIRRICLESGDHPGFYPINPVSLMVMPVQMEVQDVNVLEYLSLLFNQDFLISVRNSSMARFQIGLTTQDSTELLSDNTITGIIATLMLGLSLDSLQKSVKLSDRILTLEQQMDREPDSVDIDEISDRRSQLLTLESIVQGQLPIVEATIPVDKTSEISERTREYLKWATANLNSANKKLEWLGHRIDIMRITIGAYGQDNMNRRLGRLTVLSMLFMPITFMAGIWGMNFDFMPELHYKSGYLMALGAMFLIAGAMYLYFKRRGWFK